MWRLLQVMKLQERQRAAFLNLAPSPPLLLQVPWDSILTAIPPWAHAHHQPLPWGKAGEKVFHPKLFRASMVAVQLLVLGWTCLHYTVFLHKTVCHFRCSIHRFHQHLILVVWILVTSHFDVVKRARASLVTFMKIQMTALPKWLWK